MTFRDLPYADRSGHGARTEMQGLILQTCRASSLGTVVGCGKAACGFHHTQLQCWAAFHLNAKLTPKKLRCSAPLKLIVSEIPRGQIFLYDFIIFSSVAGRGLLRIFLGTLENPICSYKTPLKIWPKPQICMFAFWPRSLKMPTKFLRIALGDWLSFSISENAGLIMLRTFPARIIIKK